MFIYNPLKYIRKEYEIMELRRENEIVKCDTGFSMDILLISYYALLLRKDYKDYIEFSIFLLIHIIGVLLSIFIFLNVPYFYKGTIHIILFNIILAIFYNKLHIAILLKKGWTIY